MQLFLEGRYTDSMEQFETEIHRVPEDAHSARWQLRCNLIACLYGNNELYHCSFNVLNLVNFLGAMQSSGSIEGASAAVNLF